MIEVDGGQKSGSGTILRLSVAFAAISGQPLHIYNIRHNRPNPGLRPQHLEAVLTAAKLCNAHVEGAALNSREIIFKPGNIRGGSFEAEIGTAGSISMLIMTVLPICLFAEDPVYMRISKGGTDVSGAPTINYMRHVFLPVLRRMGVNANIIVQRYGYYPKGMGEVILTVQPCKELKHLLLENFGNIKAIQGVSLCTFLADRRVAERQAAAAKKHLRENGYTVDIQTVNDMSNPLQKGSSIVLWAETDSGAILGADAIGEINKTSEAVGMEAAEKLLAELSSKATVDTHLADMLVPYIALAEGKSAYLTRNFSDHLETNIWLAEKFLNVKFKVERKNELYRVEKED
ncbi:MAG: RNA 3'-terminal phosphate cyclase [Candidatus Bathyarchaeota archaeon]|nr:RNA 3'-terminal phosphate cyclase [Candidatus Bathyarchaeota archaeon]MCX8177350.1 RNA 3'-terminal phosphate cyclase [Candidatus Bathyarchaeota archaeon]MDW8193796.1 RNA 3'-terminal phosphate cyclase [Nitrososphaerota archaeon]